MWRFTDYEESEVFKASLCEDEHNGMKKRIQVFVKILILLHKIWTSMNVERLWCVASENSVREGNADTDIKKLPFSIVLFISSSHVLMCTLCNAKKELIAVWFWVQL